MIFVDSSALVARIVVRDQHHGEAKRLWAKLESAPDACITTNLVISETLTLIARATTYEFAARQARELYASRALEIDRPDIRDEIEAVTLFARYADHQMSFTDCLSFSVMRRRGIRQALAFDRDFEIAGFELLR